MDTLRNPAGNGFSLREAVVSGGIIDACCGLLVLAAVTSSLLVIAGF